MEVEPEVKPADDYGASARAQFLRFLTEYSRDEDAEGGAAAPPHYLQRVRDMLFADQKTLFVDCSDLEDFDPKFADTLKDDYVHLEPYLSQALAQVVESEEGLSGRATEPSAYLVSVICL